MAPLHGDTIVIPAQAGLQGHTPNILPVALAPGQPLRSFRDSLAAVIGRPEQGQRTIAQPRSATG